MKFYKKEATIDYKVKKPPIYQFLKNSHLQNLSWKGEPIWFSFFFFFFFFGGLFSANSRFPNSSGYGESFLWQFLLVINVFMMIKTWNSCIIRPGLSRLEWWVGRPIQWFYFWWAVSLLWALVEVNCISNGGDSRLN